MHAGPVLGVGVFHRIALKGRQMAGRTHRVLPFAGLHIGLHLGRKVTSAKAVQQYRDGNKNQPALRKALGHGPGQ